MQCIFSIPAELDLEEIGDFIARDNPRRAVSFVHELRQRCQAIADMPFAAPLREYFGEGVRIVPFGRYLIFYTVQQDKIRIERILHGSREIDQNFFH